MQLIVKRRGTIWDLEDCYTLHGLGHLFGGNNEEREILEELNKKINGPDHYFFKYRRASLGNDPAGALLIHTGGCV